MQINFASKKQEHSQINAYKCLKKKQPKDAVSLQLVQFVNKVSRGVANFIIFDCFFVV